MVSKEVEKILPLVQKPGRYIGGELNSVIKDKEKVALRYAFCFPDSYEIGMSHLGMKILYSLINLFHCKRARGRLVRARFCSVARHGGSDAQALNSSLCP